MTPELNFSVILNDLKEKYKIDEGNSSIIEPIGFIEKLCQCEDQLFSLNANDRQGPI